MDQVYFTAYDNNSRPWPQQPAANLLFSEKNISLTKAADGATLRLGYTLQLVSGVHVSISGIFGEVAFSGKPAPLALGMAIDPSCHVIDTDYEFAGFVRQSIIKSYLRLPLTLSALETVERLREGSPPNFTINLHASVLVRNKQSGHYDACRLDVGPGGQVQLSADRDVWTQQVRNVAPIGSVFVEIPLAVNRAAPWDQVWKRLESASANLAHGGEMGCKNCVTEVRQALDAWKAIENFGAGASPADKKKDQRARLLDSAKALLHYCSLSVHPDEHQVTWTRADAVMALSTLCALLSARNP